MAKPPSFTQNTIKGTAKDDTLVGGTGHDKLVGGAGNDVLFMQDDDMAGAPSGALIYDGGTGNDTLNASLLTHGVGIDLYIGPYVYPTYQGTTYTAPFFNPAQPRLAGAISGIENVVGSNYADYLQGDAGNNLINGGGGDDYISGNRGTDRLIGGAGRDFIVLSQHYSTVTGDDPANSSLHENDVFYSGGNDAGLYARSTITDFDLKTNTADTQFDELRLYDYQTLQWTTNSAGDLVGVRYANGQAIGEIVLQGIHADQAGQVEVTLVDINNNVTPYDPSFLM